MDISESTVVPVLGSSSSLIVLNFNLDVPRQLYSLFILGLLLPSPQFSLFFLHWGGFFDVSSPLSNSPKGEGGY